MVMVEEKYEAANGEESVQLRVAAHGAEPDLCRVGIGLWGRSGRSCMEEWERREGRVSGGVQGSTGDSSSLAAEVSAKARAAGAVSACQPPK